jgi:predicted phage-related endonuclease
MVYWGNVHEETVAREYAKAKGCKVKKVTNTLYHKKYPFILCHLDRKVVGIRKILECKFASPFSKEWGESGSDIVPLSYIVQVQQQLAVTEYELADLAVLIGGYDFRIYPINRDEEIINKIITEVKNFWVNHVLADIPPQPTTRRDFSLKYPRNDENFLDASPEILELIIKLKEARNRIKIEEALKQDYEKQLMHFIQDKSGIRLEDQVIATWKSDKNGNRILRIRGDNVAAC